MKESKWGDPQFQKRITVPQSEVAKIIRFGPSLEYKNRDFLYQKYVIEGLTCQEIADLISSSRTTVLKYLKEFEISVRRQGVNSNRKRGLPYGSKVRAKEEAEHKRELENVKKMRELRGKGYSYWKIAEIFNSMKIPTKTKRGKWHAKTIQQILNNN